MALIDGSHKLRRRGNVGALQEVHQRAEASADVAQRIGTFRRSAPTAARYTFERGEFLIQR